MAGAAGTTALNATTSPRPLLTPPHDGWKGGGAVGGSEGARGWQAEAVGDSQRSATQYDLMAETYPADNMVSPFNEYYERPATKLLVGDVSGSRVLELGCGAGPLTEWLVEQGAVVTGLDVSAGMVRLAQARVGDRARIVVGDLAAPLEFANASFDMVIASLVFHYLRDWAGPLSELRRVLAPGGAVVFSTHHPTMDARVHSPEDYFAVKQVTVWHKGTATVTRGESPTGQQ